MKTLTDHATRAVRRLLVSVAARRSILDGEAPPVPKNRRRLSRGAAQSICMHKSFDLNSKVTVTHSHYNYYVTIFVHFNAKRSFFLQSFPINNVIGPCIH